VHHGARDGSRIRGSVVEDSAVADVRGVDGAEITGFVTESVLVELDPRSHSVGGGERDVLILKSGEGAQKQAGRAQQRDRGRDRSSALLDVFFVNDFLLL